MSSQYPVPKWIEQLHAGKEEAYRILFDEYYQMLCVFAMKYIKERGGRRHRAGYHSGTIQPASPVQHPRCPQIVFVPVRKKQGPQFPAPSAGTRTLSEYFGGRRKFFPEQYHPRRGILSSAKNDRGTLRPCAENYRNSPMKKLPNNSD